jgi:hypothetical protein
VSAWCFLGGPELKGAPPLCPGHTLFARADKHVDHASRRFCVLLRHECQCWGGRGEEALQSRWQPKQLELGYKAPRPGAMLNEGRRGCTVSSGHSYCKTNERDPLQQGQSRAFPDGGSDGSSHIGYPPALFASCLRGIFRVNANASTHTRHGCKLA